MIPPTLYIATRFIISRKRSLILSMLGVVCGVGFFICTQAQTQGFEKYFIQSVLGTSGAIVVSDRFQARYTQFSGTSAADMVASSGQQARKYYEGITDPYRIMRVARSFSNVLGAAPIIRGSVSIASSFQSEVLRLEGIDMRYHLGATALREQIISGTIDGFGAQPSAIILGWMLADKLQVRVGDNVTVTAPTGTRTFKVVALSRSGINIIDETRGYINLSVAQSLLGKPSAASIITLRLRDPSRAPELAAHLERLFSHRARSWQERERGNLALFSTLKISAGITVSLIILLAGFGIFNVLTLTVLEKLREIAILRSMGYRRWDISAIFLWQGLIIATLGSLLGCGLGALLTFLVSLIPINLRGVIFATHFVVDWNLHHYLYGSAIAFVAVLVATFFPAQRAASVPPVDILRGSGQ
ncbi:MAG: ABC transporter permease [Candidatus Methylacidiphilales bacterium]